MDDSQWLEKASKKANAVFEAWYHKETLKEQGTVFIPKGMIEPDDDLVKLPVWQRTSTTKYVIKESPTGAAILPNSLILSDDLPRVKGWKTILAHIGKAYLAEPWLLRDIVFQHHQSTNGRWNEALNRFERWGVRSVDEWRYPPQLASELATKRTFDRMKARLVDAGLIIAEAHIWAGKNRLWIKPTEELSRIMFDPDYWAEVKTKHYVKVKPRGISARHAALDAELLELYHAVIAGHYDSALGPERWTIFERLTKPIKIGNTYTRRPFIVKGTHRFRRVLDALVLDWT